MPIGTRMGASTLFATSLVKTPTTNLLATKPVGVTSPAPSTVAVNPIAIAPSPLFVDPNAAASQPTGPSAPSPTNVAPIQTPAMPTTQPAPIVVATSQPIKMPAPTPTYAVDPTWYEPEPQEPYTPSAPIPVPRPAPRPAPTPYVPASYQQASEVKAAIDAPPWMWIVGGLALAGGAALVARKKKWI